MVDQGQSKFSAEVAIKFSRKALGLSQRELGRRTGMSPAYVSAVESGRIHPSLRSFSKLARELRLTAPELQAIMSAESALGEDV